MAYSVAQTFLVDRESGAYATRCDIYFSAKDTQFPITLHLAEVIDGNPTRKIIPFSKVTLPPEHVFVSNDGTKPTPFWFESPVYLQGDTEYAIVLSPGADSPNYNVWTARLGDTVVGTDDLISKQAAVGVFYASTNGRTWTPYQEYDLKFQLKSASFVPSGTIVFTNENADFLTVANTTGQFELGEIIQGNTSSNTVASNSNYANSAGFGFFKYYSDGNQNKPVISPVTTAFTAGQTVRGLSSNTTAVIASIDDIVVDSSFLKSEFLDQTGTIETYSLRSHSTAGVIDSGFKQVQLNETINFVTSKKIYSWSNEQTALSGRKSGKVKIDMSTDYTNLSAAFDDDRFSSYAISNLVNNDASGEESPNGGNALARYISRSVTLEVGQDAEDLLVYLDAYKPQSTDIKVYYKILNSSDSDDFSEKSWVLMEQETDSTTYSIAQNFEDIKEFKYIIPSAKKTGTVGEVQYVNSAGATFTGYITFAVKIVLLASSTSEVPRVRNMRAIALQI